jgi:hypothetical protein
VFVVIHFCKQKIRKKGKKRKYKKIYILVENKKYISVRRIYQNTKIAKDWMKWTKYLTLKILTVYFQMMDAILVKKIQFELGNSKFDV